MSWLKLFCSIIEWYDVCNPSQNVGRFHTTAVHDYKGEAMSRPGEDCRRKGFVSVWTGAFPSVEDAEAYFGIPDEIGVYLPPESFIEDLGLDDVPADSLEVHFEQMSPRTLPELLKDVTFSASFRDQVIAAATHQGVQTAQGIALLYDFDYQSKPGCRSIAGPLRFLGAFPFLATHTVQSLEPGPDPRFKIHEIMDDLL